MNWKNISELMQMFCCSEHLKKTLSWKSYIVPLNLAQKVKLSKIFQAIIIITAPKNKKIQYLKILELYVSLRPNQNKDL